MLFSALIPTPTPAPTPTHPPTYHPPTCARTRTRAQQVERRFSEFDALRKELEKDGVRTDAQFPKKDKIGKLMGFRDTTKDKRRVALNQWLSEGDV